ASPYFIADIDRVAGLEYVKETGAGLAIGALSRMAVLARDETLWKHCPLLAHVCGQVGDPQVRHRGTIGGSVAHGDPASDPPTALLALDGEIVARGPGGERTIPAGEFFTSLFETALQPTEVLTSIRVPKLASGTGWSYQKFHRRAIDWAIVGAAAVVDRQNGNVGTARVALTNMDSKPVRAAGVESAAAGAGTDADSLAAAASHAAEGTNPPSDTNGSAE